MKKRMMPTAHAILTFHPHPVGSLDTSATAPSPGTAAADGGGAVGAAVLKGLGRLLVIAVKELEGRVGERRRPREGDEDDARRRRRWRDEDDKGMLGGSGAGGGPVCMHVWVGL